MNRLFYILAFILSITACQSQPESIREVGGPCEGCEAAMEYGERNLSNAFTLPGYHNSEFKLHISGQVFKKDGRTPAADVILYIYHTDREGLYITTSEKEGWVQRHGDIRGWIKTKRDGRYSFKTFRPASYPTRDEPEHIHLTVKEPCCTPYYLDDFVFDDDPLLTQNKRQRLKNRGGSGVVSVSVNKEISGVHRDIILGLNIPNYD